ncbi:copper resistance protein CopC [Aeromicrobium sp. 179-A 4D2 NHS]|uniref:copper resistance CopC family protein n=1 Tax=Aeromicrobium sp. 179-A 4D2 NHS TaxID=3142375 RepID=UPI0039A05E93
MTAAFVTLLVLAPAVPAQAHTGLISSDPADDSTAQTTPERIQLRFTDPMSSEFSKVSITIGTSPRRVLVVDPETSGSTVSVDLSDVELPPPPRGSGDVAWDVAYRVISADGHPVDGTIRFTAPLPPATTLGDTGSHESKSPKAEPSTAAAKSNGGDFRSTAILIGVGVALACLLPLSILLWVIKRDQRRRRATSE